MKAINKIHSVLQTMALVQKYVGDIKLIAYYISFII